MRVLVITSTFPRSINDTQPAFVHDLCKYLHANGVTVDVIAPHAEGSSRQETMQGINVYRYRYFFSRLQTLAYNGGILANLKKNRLNYFLVPFFLVSQGLAVRRQLKKHQYNAIHAHWIIPQAFTCVLLGKCLRLQFPPVLCTAHGGDLYALNGFLLRHLKWWILHRVDRLAVVSRAMKEYAIGNFSMAADRISIMPMGVDLVEKFKPLDGVTREPLRIIFVGRLVDKKGAVHAVDAVQILQKDFPGIELIIAGDGPLREQLQQRTRTLGIEDNVRFTGSVSQQELPALYSSAAVAVVPSVIDDRGDQEGLGLVAIEAMGCGCAVVASALDAIRDVIDDETGLLFEPGDAGDLAAKMRRLFKDEERRRVLAARGREWVLEQFDWQVSGRRYLDCLQQLSGPENND